MKKLPVLRTAAISVTVGVFGGWILCQHRDVSPKPPGENAIASRDSESAFKIRRKPAEIAVAASARPEAYPEVLTPLLQQVRTVLTAVSGEQDCEQRAQLIEQTASRIPLGDIAEGVSFLDRQWPTETVVDLRSRLLARWAETDPEAAAEAALAIDNEHRQNAINTVMGVWADREIAEAIAWARDRADESVREDTLLAIAFDAARSSPGLAIELALDLPESPLANVLVAHAVAQWATQAPQAAATWVQNLPDEPLRERLIAAVATAEAELDPIAAANFALDALAQGRAQSDALTGIVQRWVQNNPRATANWVAQFPEGDLRNASLENLVKLWADQDSYSAGVWINGLVGKPGRDIAVRAYAEHLAPFSYSTAVTWARSIADPEIRDREIESISKLYDHL